jgi:hypothetical protein
MCRKENSLLVQPVTTSSSGASTDCLRSEAVVVGLPMHRGRFHTPLSRTSSPLTLTIAYPRRRKDLLASIS